MLRKVLRKCSAKQSGKLQKVLSKSSRRYREDQESTQEKLQKIIEDLQNLSGQYSEKALQNPQKTSRLGSILPRSRSSGVINMMPRHSSVEGKDGATIRKGAAGHSALDESALGIESKRLFGCLAQISTHEISVWILAVLCK